METFIKEKVEEIQAKLDEEEVIIVVAENEEVDD